jgi:hypothetical protein
MIRQETAYLSCTARRSFFLDCVPELHPCFSDSAMIDAPTNPFGKANAKIAMHHTPDDNQGEQRKRRSDKYPTTESRRNLNAVATTTGSTGTP